MSQPKIGLFMFSRNKNLPTVYKPGLHSLPFNSSSYRPFKHKKMMKLVVALIFAALLNVVLADGSSKCAPGQLRNNHRPHLFLFTVW
jgi:hypothetical protein